jgi:hypothetical protein
MNAFYGGDDGRGRANGSSAFREGSHEVIVGLLLLPAGHAAASSDATAAAMRTVEAIDARLAASSQAELDEWYVRSREAGRAMVPIPKAAMEFSGPYAFVTPNELRHSVLPGAHLRHLGLRHFGVGPAFLLNMIDVAEAPLPVAWIDLAEPQLPVAWEPSMAPWALAVAHACGGFPRGVDAVGGGTLAPSIFMSMPFEILCRAVRYAPDIAHAILNLHPKDPYAFVGVDKPSGDTTDYDAGGNLLRVHLLRLQTGRSLDPELFRRLVMRCSDQTLNALHLDRHSVLHDIVKHCRLLSCNNPRVEGLVDMALAIVDRAEPDGSGADLHQRSVPSPWIAGADSQACTAFGQVWTLLAPPRPLFFHPDLDRLVHAFTAALTRQRTFRNGLLPALRAALVPHSAITVRDNRGLPLPELIQLVADYILRPP